MIKTPVDRQDLVDIWHMLYEIYANVSDLKQDINFDDLRDDLRDVMDKAGQYVSDDEVEAD